jgi:hypothetical protein
MDATDQLHFLAALSKGKEPLSPLKRRLGGAWSQSGWTGEEKILFPLPGIKLPSQQSKAWLLY